MSSVHTLPPEPSAPPESANPTSKVSDVAAVDETSEVTSTIGAGNDTELEEQPGRLSNLTNRPAVDGTAHHFNSNDMHAPESDKDAVKPAASSGPPQKEAVKPANAQEKRRKDAPRMQSGTPNGKSHG